MLINNTSESVYCLFIIVFRILSARGHGRAALPRAPLRLRLFQSLSDPSTLLLASLPSLYLLDGDVGARRPYLRAGLCAGQITERQKSASSWLNSAQDT